MSDISREKALIFRITHIDNVPWILSHGIHCQSAATKDPAFRSIGDPDLIARRSTRKVPIAPGGTLSDYVPFYFTPHSPMLYKIKTGNGVPRIPMDDIVILVSSLQKVVETGTPFVYTDRHAYVQTARYLADLHDLDCIDWHLLRERNFQRDPNHPDRNERYQAEALVHRHLPVSALLGIACHGPGPLERLLGMQATVGVCLKTVTKGSWYFR